MKLLTEHEEEMYNLTEVWLKGDLIKKPLNVLTNGNLVSYELNDSDPIISKLVYKYNEREYTFHIDSIDIKPISGGKSGC
jgi:hypothetical protein